MLRQWRSRRRNFDLKYVFERDMKLALRLLKHVPLPKVDYVIARLAIVIVFVVFQSRETVILGFEIHALGVAVCTFLLLSLATNWAADKPIGRIQQVNRNDDMRSMRWLASGISFLFVLYAAIMPFLQDIYVQAICVFISFCVVLQRYRKVMTRPKQSSASQYDRWDAESAVVIARMKFFALFGSTVIGAFAALFLPPIVWIVHLSIFVPLNEFICAWCLVVLLARGRITRKTWRSLQPPK